MSIRLQPATETDRLLSIRDLTDPREPHAIQFLVEDAVIALRNAWRCPHRLVASERCVSVFDNFDALGYPENAAARDCRYTRYLSETAVLRTHTTAMIPGALRKLALAPELDVLLVCAGIVFRRDRIDRLHTGQPHQLDLWRLRADRPLTTESLDAMIERLMTTLLPDHSYRTRSVEHPYTASGLEIEVRAAARWVEVGECGLASPTVLASAGLSPSRYTGLAMGLGLDRILMLRKGIDDIRLLRSADPRVKSQMLDLCPYRSVSDQPSIARDLSLAVALDRTPEELGDCVRRALGGRSDDLEALEVLCETPFEQLPEVAAKRLGMQPSQKNVLLRIVLRSVDRALTSKDANAIRDEVFAALHEGSVHQWARRDCEASVKSRSRRQVRPSAKA